MPKTSSTGIAGQETVFVRPAPVERVYVLIWPAGGRRRGYDVMKSSLGPSYRTIADDEQCSNKHVARPKATWLVRDDALEQPEHSKGIL